MKINNSLQNAGLVAATIILAVAIIWINVYTRSVKYFNEGESFYKAGRLMEAVTSYETSAHAYTPFNSHVARSMDRMWEIGQLLEKTDIPQALVAYRCLRSSVYAIRSLYMPYKEWIPKCDERIAALVSDQQ